MVVEIRRMGADDLDQVLAIAESLPEAPHWPRSAYIKAIDPLATPRRIALVASEAGPGTILGFAVASALPPLAELETIAVAKQCQRAGVGRQLFQRLAVELKTVKVDELQLEVRISNDSAFAFYRSLGFEETGRRNAYYADPIEDALMMRLEIG